MTVRLKPLDRQVVVLTGATSGIGLATARLLCHRGARLVLAARNGEALDQLAREIRTRGGEVETVVADVAMQDEVEAIANKAITAFGGFDTWINNAAVAIYGTVDEVPIQDQRHLFDINYWGVVYGSLAASRHLENRGGAIINVGSVLSDRAINVQGPYSASKHAVKAFTDALRMELEARGAPVSVTLIKPSSIHTPYVEHARLYTDAPGATVPPPAYDPALVAKAIAHACEHQKRALVVGFGGYAISLMGNLFPRLTDYVMEAVGRAPQTTDDPGPRDRRDNLYRPRSDLDEHSRQDVMVRKTSLLLEAQLHPVATAVVMAGLGLAAARLLMGSSPPPRKGYYRQPVRSTPGNGRHREEMGPGAYSMAGHRPARERRVSH
jgi:short-subunit dehydrogenase